MVETHFTIYSYSENNDDNTSTTINSLPTFSYFGSDIYFVTNTVRET